MIISDRNKIIEILNHFGFIDIDLSDEIEIDLNGDSEYYILVEPVDIEFGGIAIDGIGNLIPSSVISVDKSKKTTIKKSSSKQAALLFKSIKKSDIIQYLRTSKFDKI